MRRNICSVRGINHYEDVRVTCCVSLRSPAAEPIPPFRDLPLHQIIAIILYFLFSVIGTNAGGVLVQTVAASEGYQHFGSNLVTGGGYSPHLLVVAGTTNNDATGLFYHWQDGALAGPNSNLTLTPAMASGTSFAASTLLFILSVFFIIIINFFFFFLVAGDRALLHLRVANFDADGQHWFPSKGSSDIRSN